MRLRSTHLWAALDHLAEERGLSPSALAISAGLDPTAFNLSKRARRNGRERWPSTETIAKVLVATELTLTEFAQRVEGLDGARRKRAKR